MIRRKTMFKLRKFFVIFFSLLLVFIWCNHNTSAGPESHVEHLPSPKAKPIDQDQQGRTEHTNRKWPSPEEILTKVAEPESSDISDKYLPEDDEDFESQRKLKRKRRIHNLSGRYFVSSSKCSMPYVDPFSSEALAFLQPVKYKSCTNESDLFTLKYDIKLQQYRLNVNATVLSELSHHPMERITCNYREVADDINAEVDTKSFEKSVVLSRKSNGIVAGCHEEGKTQQAIQQDAFPLLQILNKTSKTKFQPLNKRPSVIILGLDSLSRMNFKRTMPKTSRFVKELGFFEMEGYNKVGDTTFSNLCAIFAGEQSDKKCLKRFPLIWRKFQESGYTTAFAEDILRSSVPLEIPSDYQLHSLQTVISETMSTFRRFGFEYCMGRRVSFSYLYDFCMQFTQRMIEELDQPAFGLFWSSTFTRNYPLGSISLDDKFMEYLEIMQRHRVFERSIVILLSDQGQKAGDLVEMPDTFLEERLPMLHIHLPEWFQETYPNVAENLNLNRNRLTSPFDLHNTLRHILQLSESNSEELPITQYCPTSQSLFHLIPQDRSCEEAGIGMHWCTCNEFVLQPNDVSSYFLGKLLVYHINNWMLKRKFNRFCQRLQLHDLDYVERKLVHDDSTDGQVKTYSLRIRTYPLGGVFEATIRYSRELNEMVDFRMSDISSMINYHKHSMCVDDRRAKKFCFCYPENMDGNMKEWRNLKKKKFT
ncbi:uncharacterized protein LOC127010676 [Drosophila biarmipes]|uniref:uncharacterized protein LOC108033367 n=1 Tax=Drosophila biarmipes TaxID=125945 RepID=UPI0021CCCE27|nr:uncharacterized protein LOC108033367 [Drosophila biarmipes]XP_050741032.1 uncharacterized protein LOC127010676 [Drosophila biarmipes]